MTDVKGGYQRPTTSNYISDTFKGHQNRPKPSTEPGTDYGVAYGSKVFAAEDGIVLIVDHSNQGAEGRRLHIGFNDGQSSSDIHLSRIIVNSGQKVKRGDHVAYSGASAWGKDWGVGAHVHKTLFPTHDLRFGTYATLDFELQVGADNDGPAVTYDQVTADRQNFLNAFRGEKLVVDGIQLPGRGDTTAAIKRYQAFLGTKDDGVWGNETQRLHQAYWDKLHAAPLNPAYHRATVADLAELQYVNGLQKIAHLYGYGKGKPQSSWMDNTWGGGSSAGLQAFLNQNHGGSLAAWLRAKWGYTDADDNWGPNMKAAAARAEAENFKAL